VVERSGSFRPFPLKPHREESREMSVQEEGALRPNHEERRRLGDELCGIIVLPDARAERLQRRLDQLRRFDSWLQGLTPWQQQLVPLPLALVIGGLSVWLNSLLPPVDSDPLLLRFWLGP